MANYRYQGEAFQVDALDTCEIVVSDGVNAVSVTLNNHGPTIYRVSTVAGGWWWHHDTVESAVRRACQELLKSRTIGSPEDACRSMMEFVNNLEVTG